MKTLITIIITLITLVSLYAQSPDLFNYQALALDQNGKVYSNDPIDARMTIWEGSAQGTKVYVEEHQITTSDIGIFSLQIGGGTVSQGVFPNISWKGNSFWLQVELDFNNQGYIDMGTTRFVSVPYAKHAETVTNANDADADPANEIQTLALNGTDLEISGGNTVNLLGLGGSSLWTKSGNDVKYSTGGSAIVEGSGHSTEVSPEGLLIATPLETSSLSAFQLSFQDIVGLYETHYNNDSLIFKGATGNLAFPDIATLKPTHIEFETIGLGLKSTMGPGAQRNFSFTTRSELTSDQLNMWDFEITPFQRALFSADSILLVNPAKWKTFEVQSDDEYGATVELFNPSGFSLVELGPSRDTSFGKLTPAGHLSLKDESGLTRLNANAAFGSGEIFANDDSTYAHLSPGTLDVGPWGTITQWSILDSYGRLGFDHKSYGGFLELRGDKDNGHKIAYLGTDEFFNGNGKLCLWNNYDQGEQVCLSANDFNGGILSLQGGTSENFYAGGSFNRGWAYTGDTIGIDRAGMRVNDVHLGEVYVNEGYFTVYNNQLEEKSILDEFNLRFNGENSAVASLFGKDFGFTNTGLMNLNGQNQSLNVRVGHDFNAEQFVSGNIGIVEIFDENNNVRSSMNGLGDIRGHYFLLNNFNYDKRATISTNQDDSGLIETFGSNGSLNVSITANQSGNYGWLGIYNDIGQARGWMAYDNAGMAHLTADIKNFRMEHPSDPNKEIWYASLEGPEAGAYVRGTDQLENGEAFVAFPDHFIEVANPETMTIQLTPRHWDTYGLAVVKIQADGFFVKELKGETGSFDFDWEAKGVRKGFENFKAVLTKEEVSEMLPSFKATK